MRFIITSLITAALLAGLHLRWLYVPDTRRPLISMIAIAAGGFTLWTVWEGLPYIAIVLMTFVLNCVGVLLLAEKIVAEVVLWRANRAAAAQEGAGDES